MFIALLIKVFYLKQFRLSLPRSLCLIFFLKSYFMSYSQFLHFVVVLERIKFFHIAHSALQAALFYTNFLPWQSLAGTYPLRVSFLLWFGSSWNYNLLPGLEAAPQLPGQVLCCVQYCPKFLARTSPLCVRTLLTTVYIMDSSSRKGHLLC